MFVLPNPNSSIIKSTKNFGFENISAHLSGFGVSKTLAVEEIGPRTTNNVGIVSQTEMVKTYKI